MLYYPKLKGYKSTKAVGRRTAKAADCTKITKKQKNKIQLYKDTKAHLSTVATQPPFFQKARTVHLECSHDQDPVRVLVLVVASVLGLLVGIGVIRELMRI